MSALRCAGRASGLGLGLDGRTPSVARHALGKTFHIRRVPSPIRALPRGIFGVARSIIGLSRCASTEKLSGPGVPRSTSTVQ